MMLLRLPIFLLALSTLAALASAEPATLPAAEPAAEIVSTPTPLERATQNAIEGLYAKLATERVNGHTIDAILEQAGSRPAVMAALARAQQIGGPRDLGAGLTQITLELDGRHAAQIVLDAVRVEPANAFVPSAQLARALDAWSTRSFRSTGDSGPAQAGAQTRASVLTLPEVAPDWAREAQTASSVASAAGSPLKTARVAERSARLALREQLEKLSLQSGQSLSASGSSAASSIDRVLAAAKITSIDYRADGSVEVSVSVDGQQLWQTLQLAARSE